MNPPQHIVNESYGNYTKRQILKNHRSAVWFVAIVIFFIVIYIFGSLFEKTGLMGTKNTSGQIVFEILGWGAIILAIFLGYKFFKHFYIKRRRYSRSELMNTDE